MLLDGNRYYLALFWKRGIVVTHRANTLEPLLIPTLRLLVALPLTVILVQIGIGYLLPIFPFGFLAQSMIPYQIVVPFISTQTFALFLLGQPRLMTWLGRGFLPITLFFCTLGPVSTFLLLIFYFHDKPRLGVIFPESAAYGLQGIVPMLFFLMIPLIVIAWQYAFRQIVLYALSLLLIDLSVGMAMKLFGGVDLVWLLLQFAVGRTMIFTATGYLLSRLVASQRQQRATLALANDQLAQYALTQEQLTLSRERNRLARDLHDTLAHYMSGLVLELEGVRLLWDADSTQARTTLDNAIATARTGLTETRRALQALRSSPLTDLGLIGALRDLAENMAARNQWQLALHLPSTPVILSPLVDEVIYRVVQESLTNVERHTAASLVTLTLAQVDEGLTVRIADNGDGFVQTAVDNKERFGLLGMQERAGLIGGKLTVESTVAQGTVVTLTCNGQGGSWGGAEPAQLALTSPARANGKMEIHR